MSDNQKAPQGAQQAEPIIYTVAIPVLEEKLAVVFGGIDVNQEEMARSLKMIGKLAYHMLISGMDVETLLARMMGQE